MTRLRGAARRSARGALRPPPRPGPEEEAPEASGLLEARRVRREALDGALLEPPGGGVLGGRRAERRVMRLRSVLEADLPVLHGEPERGRAAVS